MKAREPRPARLLRRVALNLLALAALAALFYWGHNNDWRAPKLSALWSRPAAPEEDWCGTHRVPQSKCIACNPTLVGADPKDWCREHGVPESRCAACHPELLVDGRARDWCAEHGVPESQCTICHPDLAVKGKLPPEEGELKVLPASADKASGDACCLLHELRIQFASEESVRKAGVKLAVVEEREMPEFVTASGEVEYDQTKVARLSARVAGTAWRVEKQLGDAVKKGAVLALIDSAEVGRARAELLQAIASRDAKERTLRRIEASTESGLRTQGELQDAEAALRAARIQVLGAQQALLNLGLSVRTEEITDVTEDKLADAVRFLGLPEELRKGVQGATLTANLLPVVSPLEGIVVSRDVVPGEAVDTTRPLLTVADTSRLRALLDLRLEDSKRLALGQSVVFRPDGDADYAASGRITWISTAVDEKTRTVKARADIENSEGRLLAHTFGSARIRVREAPSAVAVPQEAIQWEGCCHVVFVRQTPEIFQTRKVRLGARSRGYREVVVGLLPGEIVATEGSSLLKSEILKSSLGAGCAGD